MFGAIRPSSQRVMGVVVRTVVAMVGFGVHSVQAGETIVKPDQAYACTSLTRQPDSLNYVERLFANDGTYIFAWSRSESIKNAVEQRRNEHGEWLSFGRWKVIPTANGGSTLEVSEDIRYHYSDRSWHLPSESARPAFVVETVSIGATASRLATDMQPKRRGEAVPASTDGSGFTSTVKGQDYFTCIKRPGLTADKQELWRNVTPKAVEAKNTLEQRKSNREEANRQQVQNAGQTRQQAIQGRVPEQKQWVFRVIGSDAKGVEYLAPATVSSNGSQATGYIITNFSSPYPSQSGRGTASSRLMSVEVMCNRPMIRTAQQMYRRGKNLEGETLEVGVKPTDFVTFPDGTNGQFYQMILCMDEGKRNQGLEKIQAKFPQYQPLSFSPKDIEH